MSFRNPSNDYVVTVNSPALWCLLFGGFYFMKHEAWGSAIIAIIAAICTGGLAWLVYPFFARRILRNAYLRRGWIEGKPVFA